MNHSELVNELKNTDQLKMFKGVTKNIIQPKLFIGQVNDQFEQEADQVMNTPQNNSSSIQRKCASCKVYELQMKPYQNDSSQIVQKQEEEEEMVQMKSSNSKNSSTTNLETSLHDSKGGGQSIDSTTQKNMSESLGADFSNVKVHTNNDAIQMNQNLNAKAFTNGADVYFNQGQYNPQSSEGKRLLAHELTHVVQQNKGGKCGDVQRDPVDKEHYLVILKKDFHVVLPH